MKIPPNRLIWFLLIISIVQNSYSQQFELAGIRYSNFIASEVTQDLTADPEIKIEELGFFFNIPKKLKNDKTMIINGIDLNVIYPTIQTNLNNNINSENLYTITYRLMVNQLLKNDWRMIVSLMPTISSSFNNSLEGDDFLFNGAVVFSKEKNESISYGFGAIITSQFGSPIPIPTFRFIKATEVSTLSIILPNSVGYNRHFGDLSVGAQLKVGGSQYNTSYLQPANPDINGSVEQIRYSRITFGPTFQYRINKLIIIKSTVGIALNRTYELRDTSDDKIDYSLDNGPFIQFGLSLAPKLDKEQPKN